MGADNWETWIGQEADVTIWEMQDNGTIGSEVRTLEFFQQFRWRPVRHNISFRQPGSTREDRRSRIVGYELEFNELSKRADQQLDPYLDDTKLFRIKVGLHNTDNGALGQDEERDFRFARVVDGPGETIVDNDSSPLDLRLFAETLDVREV